MDWLFVVIGFFFLSLMGFVIKLHREFIRLKKASSVALEALEDDHCA